MLCCFLQRCASGSRFRCHERRCQTTRGRSRENQPHLSCRPGDRSLHPGGCVQKVKKVVLKDLLQHHVFWCRDTRIFMGFYIIDTVLMLPRIPHSNTRVNQWLVPKRITHSHVVHQQIHFIYINAKTIKVNLRQLIKSF